MAQLSIYYVVSRFVLYFFLYAFIGWAYEVVFALVQCHRYINRGFFFGPICPIYGFGALMAILLFSPIQNYFLQFLAGALASAVMEYGTSWVLEKAFHARWWDYSDYPLNLNGRICVMASTLFGLLMLAVNVFIQPFVSGVIDLLSVDAVEMIALGLLLVFVVDATSSVVHMKSFNERLEVVKMHVTEFAKEAATTFETSPFATDWSHPLAPDSESRVKVTERLRALLPERFLRYGRKSPLSPEFQTMDNADFLEWLKDLFGLGGQDASDRAASSDAKKDPQAKDAVPTADEDPACPAAAEDPVCPPAADDAPAGR